MLMPSSVTLLKEERVPLMTTSPLPLLTPACVVMSDTGSRSSVGNRRAGGVGDRSAEAAGHLGKAGGCEQNGKYGESERTSAHAIKPPASVSVVALADYVHNTVALVNI